MDNLALRWPVWLGLTPVPIVVLAHILPSGSVHWDVLIASDPAGQSPLWSLRCDRRPDCAAAGDRIAAVRTPDHHPRWLAAEVGEVGGGRGVARRIAQGTLVVTEEGDAEIRWAFGGSCRWGRTARSLVILDRRLPTLPDGDLDHPNRTGYQP